jgi:glycosyltransferase-like protein
MNTLWVCDAHRHLGVLPAFPIYGGPPVNPDTTARATVTELAANAAGHCVRTVHHLDQFHTPELTACHERALVHPYAHICVSAAVGAELRAGWGITATVIPNGVDSARFRAAAGPAGAAARQAWRSRLGRYVLTVGEIEPRKGSLELLEAYAELHARLPQVRLVIAGGETLFDYHDYRTRWEQRATKLAVHPVVLGPVEHDALPALVAGAGTFALPSTREGFGLAAMEALAAGVSLVVRDLPVFREIFSKAARFARDTGQLAQQLHASLTTDSALARQAGQALAARYTWAAAAQRHLQLYRQLSRGEGLAARPRGHRQPSAVAGGVEGG